MIDLKKAMLDPTRVFGEPADVVASNELTRDQKIEILRRWEYDAHQLEVAEEEAGEEDRFRLRAGADQAQRLLLRQERQCVAQVGVQYS